MKENRPSKPKENWAKYETKTTQPNKKANKEVSKQVMFLRKPGTSPYVYCVSYCTLKETEGLRTV